MASSVSVNCMLHVPPLQSFFLHVPSESEGLPSFLPECIAGHRSQLDGHRVMSSC